MSLAALLLILAALRFWSATIAPFSCSDINIICESFHLVSFASVSLNCNRVTLAFVSVAKEEEEAISWFEECPIFSFQLYNVIINQ